MQSFKYLCIDDLGQRRAGSLRASTQDKAKKELLDRGWSIITLGEDSYADGGQEAAQFHLPESQRQRFYLKLSILMQSGVPIVEALEGTARQENQRFSEWVEAVTQEVASGHPLSESISRQRAYFEESDLALIKLGEQSGSLVRILGRLAEQKRRQLDREKELKAKLTYPVVQLFVLGAICLLLGSYLGPQLSGLVESFGVEQPLLTRWVSRLFSPDILSWVALTVTLLGIIAFLTWSSPAGTQVRNHLLDSVALLRKLRLEVLLSRICRMLAHLLQSGFDWQRSLSLCRTGSERADAAIGTFRKTLLENDFEQAVEESKLFTPLLKSLILVGYEAQKIPEMLLLYADMLEENVDRRIELVLSLLEPALLLIMGSLVGVVVIASFLPVMDLVQKL